MRVGFSFSPGGLLLPYHLGVLASLQYHGFVTDKTPLAGSSAGAIAVASHACGVRPEVALDASIRISGSADPFFVAKGNLMPSLRRELNTLLSEDAHQRLNLREGMVGLAYRELFPTNRAILQTKFDTRNSLIDAICDSSMFPYFTSNRPFRTYYPDDENFNQPNKPQRQKKEKNAATSKGAVWRPRFGRPERRRRMMPRVTVDGIFATPLHRFGCPDFGQSSQKERVDRTVRVLALPHELVDINPIKENCNIISPKLENFNMLGQVTQMGLMAITKSRPNDLKNLYEAGWDDAAEWAAYNK